MLKMQKITPNDVGATIIDEDDDNNSKENNGLNEKWYMVDQTKMMP